jgi:hypothetical protein
VAQVLTVAISCDELLYQIQTVFSVLPWSYLTRLPKAIAAAIMLSSFILHLALLKLTTTR